MRHIQSLYYSFVLQYPLLTHKLQLLTMHVVPNIKIQVASLVLALEFHCYLDLYTFILILLCVYVEYVVLNLQRIRENQYLSCVHEWRSCSSWWSTVPLGHSRGICHGDLVRLDSISLDLKIRVKNWPIIWSSVTWHIWKSLLVLIFVNLLAGTLTIR
jgi:hypothetical protein